MRKFDEPVLPSRPIRLDEPYSDVHQALHSALAAEFEARAFARRMIEAYGARAPFPALLAGSEKRVAWLIAAGQKLGMACPTDYFSATNGVAVSASWLENCARAASGESALGRRYQKLLLNGGGGGGVGGGVRALSRLFEKLLRQSVSLRIPLLLRAISTAQEQERFHAVHGVPPEEAYLKHGLFSTLLEKAFSVLGADHHTLRLFSPVLRSTNPALLTGVVVGGAAALALKKKSSFKRKAG